MTLNSTRGEHNLRGRNVAELVDDSMTMNIPLSGTMPRVQRENGALVLLIEYYPPLSHMYNHPPLSSTPTPDFYLPDLWRHI
ncbi:hypothetical protein PROFUN_00898 [Planoprotostelium fungivorum]|uniref:Uncharacterized protein n=1 Tax=Planoprotostelium fungivorum TaxID=1890364 RepID=A0A2P6P0A8_9EUKA|nr:hypothetical protein PROFUN_00898 [Planoprotostelium fungivorum]